MSSRPLAQPTTPAALNNPYLETFQAMGAAEAVLQSLECDGSGFNYTQRRKAMVRHFAWAIPNEVAIRAIAQLSPIVEIGAGGGYWAKLLTDAGADVVAYDREPPEPCDPECQKSHWSATRWFPVRLGDAHAILEHQDRTLFLCWPPYDTPMAAHCVRAFRGQYVVYVGEGPGGCTGDDTFHNLLARRYELHSVIDIPRWEFVNDTVHIFRRKSQGS